MSRRLNKTTPWHIRERRRIEEKLAMIPAINVKARELFTTEGFIRYYLEMMDLYETYFEAYERLEEFYESIFGCRRYSEYFSFRVILRRYLNK